MRRTSLLAALAFALLAAPADAGGSGEVALTLFHVNDTHAHLKPYQPKRDGPRVGGFAELAALLAAERRKKPNSLFLHAGNAFQGTLFYNFFKGEADFKCLNAMGLSALCLGNHEFDDYQEVLMHPLGLAKFDILSANLNFSAVTALNTLVKPWVIKEVAGVKVALVGLTVDDLFTLTNPKYLTGVIVNDPIDIAAREIEIVRPQADLVVLLTHLGLKYDLEIAATVEGVDVVLGGHSHAALPRPVVLTSTAGRPVVVNQAGEFTQHLGYVDLAVDPAAKTWRYVGGGLLPVSPECGSDPAVAKIIADYDAQISEKVKEVICRTTGVLEGVKEVSRAKESTLGNLIADALRDHFRADLGLCNGGGIRASIHGPDVTIENVLEAFPFDNKAVRLNLKGSQLADAFALVAKKMTEELYGGFLQVSSDVRVVYDKGRVVSLEVGGKPLEPSAVYSVAMSDFMAAGGDGFEMFRNMPAYADGVKMSDILIEWLRAKGTVEPRVEGRIVRR